MKLVHLFSCLFFIAFSQSTGANDKPPLIAVASNFSPVLEKIANRFATETGQEIRISSGASGTLYRQIEQGAPFQLFLSADESYPLKLHERGMTADAGRIYAIGQLVLYIPNQSRLDRMLSLENLLHRLVADNSYKIAMANPELAPYGRAALQVLDRYTPTHMPRGRIILGENVGQTAQFALTGSVDAVFLPYSLALTKPIQESGHFELLPQDWHDSINQRMVLLKNAGSITLEFHDYLYSETAQRIIQEFGYSLPAR